jgi:hypothetical protein
VNSDNTDGFLRLCSFKLDDLSPNESQPNPIVFEKGKTYKFSDEAVKTVEPMVFDEIDEDGEYIFDRGNATIYYNPTEEKDLEKLRSLVEVPSTQGGGSRAPLRNLNKQNKTKKTKKTNKTKKRIKGLKKKRKRVKRLRKRMTRNKKK